MFKTNFKISNYFVLFSSSSALQLEKWGAGGAGSEQASLPTCCSRGCKWWLGYQHLGRVPAGSLYYRGRQGVHRAPEARWPLQQRAPREAGRRGRGASRSCLKELARQEVSPSCCPVRGRWRRPVCPRSRTASACVVWSGARGWWLCWPCPVLILSPHPPHKGCLIKEPRLDSPLIL